MQTTSKPANVPASTSAAAAQTRIVFTQKESDRTSKRYALHINLMCERFMVGYCMTATAATVACKLHILIHHSYVWTTYASNTFSLNLKTNWIQLSANNETINTRRPVSSLFPHRFVHSGIQCVQYSIVYILLSLLLLLLLLLLVCITSRKAFQRVCIL